jgi:hypothetical protein
MKKRVCILFLFVIIFSALLVSAAENDTESKGYACLQSKVNGKCASLSTEEKIFSLLSIGKCKSELISASSSNQCWPAGNCLVKTTAQAILALDKAGTAVKSAETWILSQSRAFTDANWYLQVETSNQSSCKVTYSGSSYNFVVNSDKTVSGRLGSCLSVYQNYWIRISSSCYDQELTVSCSTPFLTSLLYQKRNSQTAYDFYVTDKTNSASAEGTTAEKIDSLCFATRGSCDYEATLWATLVLKYLGNDVSAYLPYLISLSGSNSRYIPESFLYMLTDNYRTELLTKQQENQWWAASGDKFYDTAIALLPFQNEDITEKDNAKSWLANVQGADGCWSNVKDTAFVLYSLWTRDIGTPIVTPINTTPTNNSNTTHPTQPNNKDCEDSGFYCMSGASCSSLSGNVLSNYSGCFGTNICCTKQKQLQTCSSEGGTLCSSGQQCLGGSDISSSDSTSSRLCCVDGTCGVQETTPCEVNGGNCRSSCDETTEQSSSESCTATTICCVGKKKSGSLLWLLILGILIILALVGLVFRKKLREIFLKFKFGKKPVKPIIGGSRFPMTPSSRVYPGALQRRILPNLQRTTPISKPSAPATKPVLQKPAAKKPISKAESNDLLKKLKDIGK